MAKPKSSPEEKLAAAAASGYRRGAHTENDKKKDLKIYRENVVGGQNSTLDNYIA
jgi:hypothetical protein